MGNSQEIQTPKKQYTFHETIIADSTWDLKLESLHLRYPRIIRIQRHNGGGVPTSYDVNNP